ncbi:hypothetical protein CEXT_763991 [Caerostris extrusa]|uniref:Uncharacterized protein n=1 Tax=Caerostris extrusa TaxID=172846 RepID=A0AAV4XQM0_CAEEX|nr:hypothetical protein CEXT_763991 [Caerostris extrusa]
MPFRDSEIPARGDKSSFIPKIRHPIPVLGDGGGLPGSSGESPSSRPPAPRGPAVAGAQKAISMSSL